MSHYSQDKPDKNKKNTKDKDKENQSNNGNIPAEPQTDPDELLWGIF